MSSPGFSIVIPTRNRAVLLRHALRTALDQSVTDLEIVVCDNASDDDTRAAVAEAGDERVRYVRTDRVLRADENWEFGLGHARGEWVTLLPDDDGLVPSTLERARAWLDTHDVRAVAWRHGDYTHPEIPGEWFERDEANRLIVEPWTGRVEVVDARTELERIYRLRELGPAPGLVGSLVHRSALERMRADAGAVFGAPDPFVRAAVTFLALESSYLVADLPLTVRGVSGASISFGLIHNDPSHETVRQYVADDLFTEVPLRTPTLANVGDESLLRAKRRLPDRFAGIEWNVVEYFVSCRAEIDDRRRRDDGGAAVTEWQAALRRQAPGVRTAVRRRLARRSLSGSVRLAARRMVPSRRLRRAIAAATGTPDPPLILAGDVVGFVDLVGAARHLEAAVLPQPAPVGAEAT